MLYQEIKLAEKGSMPYARLAAYILDTPSENILLKKRPAILLCPGGAYAETSYREGEPIAMYFLEKGYHVGIVRYSTAPARYPTALLELGRAVSLFHEKAEEWKVDTERIFVQGSSAGGHLAGCLAVFWNQPFLTEELLVSSEWLRPTGVVLSYPVISADEAISHAGSFQNLLGEQYAARKDSLSLEKQVGKDTVPCFLWHTFADSSVPVENTMVMAQALHRQGIKTEVHLFQEGIHGLGTAGELSRRPDGSGVQKECECWMELAERWMKNTGSKGSAK